MINVILAAGCFIAAVVIHLVYCRYQVKNRLHTKAFMVVALVVLCIYALSAMFFQGDFPLTAGFIYLLLVPCYLCFYVLTQLTSPSKKILSALAEHGEMSHAQIIDCIAQERFIPTRLEDLVLSGCVLQCADTYTISPSGKSIARLLHVLQFLLGREAGG